MTAATDPRPSVAPAEGVELTLPRPELVLAVAATYTAEPIEEPLRFWLDELGFHGQVEFAPYNQVIQELLNPSSLLGRNARGVNLVLVRFEDSVRYKPGGWDEPALRAGADELARALVAFAGRSGTPTIVAAPPPSPRVIGDPDRLALVSALEAQVKDAITPFDSVHWLSREAFGSWLDPAQSSYDEAGDRVGHMPYTPLFSATLATAVARLIHAIKSPPFKVVALDCDNTLWRGVVGEDGPHGITLGPGMKALQEFVVAQQAAGMVVCLVSKNAEADVLEAFDLRTDFPLRREHLVSWRVSWGSKAKALAELAQELNLGLDSFIFLDDNPVECAEVRAALPQVVTLQVPADEHLADFLRHAWPFDRLKVTDEDRNRTRMYRENADRSRVEAQATDVGAFLASLDLKVDIAPPSAEEWARVAQLTQRTNQFNLTTIRRSEAEVRRLDADGLECLRVVVSDRFGEYGLVGVLIFGRSNDALTLDTMLLSCRVLGRGVEHVMFAHLGRLAQERGLAFVEARYISTPKNEPARNFLHSAVGAYATPGTDDSGAHFRVPAESAAAVAYRPGSDAREQLEFARTGGGGGGKAAKSAGGGTPTRGRDRSTSYTRIINELCRPEAVLRAVEAASWTARALETPIVEPTTAVQRELVSLWRRVLRVDRVGIRDEFNDLGGNSLKAARLFVDIEAQFGVRLPMTTILDAPSIELLAERIAAAGRGEARRSLRLLKPGAEGGPALFLVHDGDGETLLYLNLARRLPDEVAVYGLEPHGNDRCPMLHTQISEMAAYYVDRVREVCPSGPYLLGGMCAGGTIAFEMASQLRQAGDAVGLVALLDAADAGAAVQPFRETRKRWARFVNDLRGGRNPSPESARKAGPGHAPAGDRNPSHPAPRASRLARLVRKGATAAGKLRRLAAFEASVRLQRRVNAARVRALRNANGRVEVLPAEFVGPSVRAVYQYAERTFQPSGQIDAPVLLVRAGAGADGHGQNLDHDADEPLLRVYRDPLFGWARRVAGGAAAIEVIDVPGGHGGMLQEPHVAAIAEALSRAIDRAHAVAVAETTP